jgi:hypothetical protein
MTFQPKTIITIIKFFAFPLFYLWHSNKELMIDYEVLRTIE